MLLVTLELISHNYRSAVSLWLQCVPSAIKFADGTLRVWSIQFKKTTNVTLRTVIMPSSSCLVAYRLQSQRFATMVMHSISCEQ